MEFACELSTAKLILVLGHSDCGAVKGAIGDPSDDVAEIEMNNLINLLEKIKPAMNAVTKPKPQNERNNKNRKFVDNVTKENVILTIENIRKGSRTLLNLEKSGEIMIVGGIHNLSDGTIKYIK